MIDTHFHFEGDASDFAIRMADEMDGKMIKRMILCGYDLSSSIRASQIALTYHKIYVTVGIHPENMSDDDNENIILLEKLLDNQKVVGIGEIGLDYYWNSNNISKQKRMFEKQIQLAMKHDLPIVIHSRSSTEDTYEIVRKYPVKGIIHCFSDDYEMALQYIKHGFYLGIGGIITFKNAQRLREVVRNIPLTSIVLETDSPYLSPVPYRGQENRPKNLEYIAKEIALIKNLPVEEIISITTSNAERLFDFH